MHWVRNGAIAVALVLMGLVIWYGSNDSVEPLPVNSRLGGEFELVDQHGEPFKSQQLEGRAVLLFFGFTHCPDICPASLARMSHVWKMLDEEGYGDEVQVVFITFDHERDTPEHLKEYLEFFGANVVGLTGTEEQIQHAAEQFGVVYLRTEDDTAEEVMDAGDGSDAGVVEKGYAYSHSDFIYLLDQQSRVRKLFKSDEDIDQVFADAKTLL